jgi:hypothetical protein
MEGQERPFVNPPVRWARAVVTELACWLPPI